MANEQAQAVKFGASGLTVGTTKFDIKRVMLSVLPAVTGILVELLTQGKISGKKRELPLIRDVLTAVVAEIDTLIEANQVQ